MYTYPNGLVCAASERRVLWFERVVPPLAMFATLIGFVLILGLTVVGSTEMLPAFVIGMGLAMLWAVLICALSYLVFHYWCLPINEGPHAGGGA